MKASELVDALQALIAQYGDLDVEDDYGQPVDVEFNSDTTPVFVIT